MVVVIRNQGSPVFSCTEILKSYADKMTKNIKLFCNLVTYFFKVLTLKHHHHSRNLDTQDQTDKTLMEEEKKMEWKFHFRTFTAVSVHQIASEW